MLPLPPERTGQASASRSAAAKLLAILTKYQTLSTRKMNLFSRFLAK
jgi:hypothetical protein